MSSQLLRIVVGELEAGESQWKLLYTDLVKFLWKNGISGASVFRMDEGIGENGDLRSQVIEEIQFNNLPISIQVVDEKEKIEPLLPKIKEKISHGELWNTPVYRIVEGEVPMNDQEYWMLKIYVKEESTWFSLPLYEEILRLLQKNHLIWSTISKGIEGFGQDHVIHKQSFFSFSSHVPILIESVGKAKVIRRIVPELKEKVQEGLIVAFPVQVMLDK